MSFSRSISLILLATLVVFLPDSGVYAFGAGNIPSYVGGSLKQSNDTDVPVRFAYMEGRAFRHGDIVCFPLQETFHYSQLHM